VLGTVLGAMTYVPWQQAWHAALYGDGGFFHRPEGPGGHFRTSATSAVFAAAVLRLAKQVDSALGCPADFTVVDVGAGRGELLSRLAAHAPDDWRLLAVEVAARPAGLPDRIEWSAALPTQVSGLVLAHELLDAVPCVIAECAADGVPRVVLVDPPTGHERLGRPLDGPDAEWLARWWPASAPGHRVEIGLARDLVWCGLVESVAAGLVVAVDYHHCRGDRDALPRGTLTGHRKGQRVPPVPDSTCDLTAHVALDACAAATRPGGWTRLTSQAVCLEALGVTSALPPVTCAASDPTAYARDLATAAQARSLLDPAGPGGFGWLLHGRGIPEQAGA
jgi:SAM-dependent MidA family methyltransferase